MEKKMRKKVTIKCATPNIKSTYSPFNLKLAKIQFNTMVWVNMIRIVAKTKKTIMKVRRMALHLICMKFLSST
jgi:hypothetical protein